MSESKLRKLNPKKLLPPADVLKHQKQKQKESRSKNPIIRFFITFLGEGL